MAGDIDALVAVYTEDGIAAPGGRDFVRGHEALYDLWALPEGRVVTHHQATPVEIRVDGDHAYDWGYYEGSVQQEGETGDFRGKYLIVWQREADGTWRILHDMWNSLPSGD
jgi:ketosteroid isomerase-like protein